MNVRVTLSDQVLRRRAISASLSLLSQVCPFRGFGTWYMTTYILSEQVDAWRISCYADEIKEVATGIPSEASAMELVLAKARENAPSKVLRISADGVSRVIATFEEEEE